MVVIPDNYVVRYDRGAVFPDNTFVTIGLKSLLETTCKDWKVNTDGDIFTIEEYDQFAVFDSTSFIQAQYSLY